MDEEDKSVVQQDTLDEDLSSSAESTVIAKIDTCEGAISKSTREIKLTAKGLEWRITQDKKRFRSALSEWRAHFNDISTLLSDSKDLSLFRNARDRLRQSFEGIIENYERLNLLTDLTDSDPLLVSRMESIESENLQLLQTVSARILELSSDDSVSQISSQSKISRASKYSNMSHKSDSLIKAAALKAKLRYIDVEARAKAELEKVKTLQRLHIEEAKLEAMQTDNIDLDSKLDELSLPRVDTNKYVANYIHEHGHINVKSETCLGNTVQDYVNTSVPTSSVDPSFPISSVFTSVSTSSTFTPFAASNISNPLLTVSQSTPSAGKPLVSFDSDVWPEAKGFVSAGLNPSAADFFSQFTPATCRSTKDSAVLTPATGLPSKMPTSSDPLVTYSVPNPIPHTAQGTLVQDQNVVDIAKSFAEQFQLSRLPPPEPGIFSGDPLKYPAWKSAFQILIEGKQIPKSERLYYLKRYVSGPVKDVIDGYLLLSSTDAYEDARKLLDERYGNPFTIACAFRERLDKWPKIVSKDSHGLVKFADFLRQCLNAMQSVPSLEVLNDSFENRKLLSRLPEWLVTRWNRIVVEQREFTHVFPPFKDFVKFVTKEAKIASDPVTSLVSLRSTGSSDESRETKTPYRAPYRQQQGPLRSRSLLSGTNDNQVSKQTPTKPVCAFCKGSHKLELCNLFLRKTLDERKSFAKDTRLCFGCLSLGHISKYCKQRMKCNECSKFHPTCLHIEHKKQVNVENSLKNDQQRDQVNKPPPIVKESHSGTAFLNYSANISMCSMVVPVYLSHCDKPDEERLVYALLDTQSDTTFILESTCDALGLSGAEVKLALSTMFAENKIVGSHKIKGLLVRGVYSQEPISLPETFSRNIIPANRSHIPTPEMARSWSHLEGIADKLMPLNECEIGLLIGYNCSRALVPREVLLPFGDGPFGQRTDLGWGVVGVVSPDSYENDLIGSSHRILSQEVPAHLLFNGQGSKHVSFSLRTTVKEIKSLDVLRLMEQEFCDPKGNDIAYSQEDQRFLALLDQGIIFKDGHYEMPLPFRKPNLILPNNKYVALNRLQSLRKRFMKDQRFTSHYHEFMIGLISKGYAERVPDAELAVTSGHLWYLPHHGVYHPQKPERIRVVFDCSSSFNGESLNSHLLQGPDLTNKLVGVICRFRKEPIAFMCDVEQMFYQFNVKPEHRDYLRFFWWDSKDFSEKPSEYRMTVHLFGATSSPGCANFGLKRIAVDNESDLGSEVADFLRRDFYVDDGLKSLPSVQEAIDLIEKSKLMCSRGGLRLHKFVSHSKEVLEYLKPEDRGKDLKDIDLACDRLPIERALGILWCIESDEFQFRVVLRDRPLTRRGILSTVGSLYDPLGFIAPVVLMGKLILQQMCADKLDWDEPLPEDLCVKWKRWCESLKDLACIKVKRCLKPEGFGKVQLVEFHHFSDASSIGYGQCSYVRMVSEAGEVHCSFLMGKSRVVPLKPVTIPRLELSAAVLSVKTASFLEKELDYDKVYHFYWTDSKVVLGYIDNESRRFHVFVANRVQQIKEKTETSQWRYVASEQNPSDIASRGAYAKELNSTLWFKGPDFLWLPELPVAILQDITVKPDDPELKQVQSFQTSSKPQQFPSVLERLKYFSDWYRAKRAIALCLRFKSKLLSQTVGKCKQVTKNIKTPVSFQSVTVDELENAEHEIVKLTQREYFSDEIKVLKEKQAFGVPNDRKGLSVRHASLKGGSHLCNLDPFLDSDGVIRVGGRIRYAVIPDHMKYPVILPRKGHVTEMVIRHFHYKVAHQGRGLTTNALRSAGFWVIGCSSAVMFLLSKCVICRKLRYSAQGQKMADLPVDRLEPAPPFTYCAVDLFGPFHIKEGRRELKRYGVLFTCMLCRAVHVETANSLETDSFINCLRRFISIRGPIRQLRSDRGTNFVGAKNELEEAIGELNEARIKDFLLKENCDIVEFKMNVPHASHMGGVWERQIRSVRNAIASLLQKHGTQLDDESLRTFLYEAAAVVNSRPLTVENVNDPQSLVPLTPNHLITMKSSVVLPPPGNFQNTDVYSRRRWRRVQYLINQFWYRWKTEFLQNLQVRKKWTSPKRNACEGDIVLIVEENQARNQWRLGRVVEAIKEDDGLVRKVKVALATSHINAKGKRDGPLVFLERPIHKIVLLQESEVIPVKEPYTF